LVDKLNSSDSNALYLSLSVEKTLLIINLLSEIDALNCAEQIQIASFSLVP